MRRSIRKALDKLTDEAVAKARDEAHSFVLGNAVDIVKNEMAIAKSCGHDEGMRYLGIVLRGLRGIGQTVANAKPDAR